MGILKKEEDLITYALYPEYRPEIPQRKDERRDPSGRGTGRNEEGFMERAKKPRPHPQAARIFLPQRGGSF